MPLTREEHEFLDAYVYEATHEPFGGPATSDLRRRGIVYADLHGQLTACHREACVTSASPLGKQNPSPPPSPWANRNEALRRSGILFHEYVRPEEPTAIVL